MLNLPEFSDPLIQNSRYKNGTTKTCSIALSVVPYFHGGNTGSNPVGDAKLQRVDLVTLMIPSLA
jgi:hypothetical protein